MLFLSLITIFAGALESTTSNFYKDLENLIPANTGIFINDQEEYKIKIDPKNQKKVSTLVKVARLNLDETHDQLKSKQVCLQNDRPDYREFSYYRKGINTNLNLATTSNIDYTSSKFNCEKFQAEYHLSNGEKSGETLLITDPSGNPVFFSGRTERPITLSNNLNLHSWQVTFQNNSKLYNDIKISGNCGNGNIANFQFNQKSCIEKAGIVYQAASLNNNCEKTFVSYFCNKNNFRNFHINKPEPNKNPKDEPKAVSMLSIKERK